MTIDRRSLLAAAVALPLANSQPAHAGDKVTVGVLRFVSSGGLFLALERGYFASEGLEVDLRFFEAAQPIAVAIASGDLSFGLTAITAGSLNLAGKGAIRIIASQGGEKKGIVGNLLVVSNQAHARGITSFEKLDGASVAITQVGSTFHYQLGQIATAKGFDLRRISIKPLQSLPSVVAAVKTGQVDAAILAPHIAGPLAERGEAKIVGPLSGIADFQYGALFASPKMVDGNRSVTERFVKAYVRGLADYAAALAPMPEGGPRAVDGATLTAATAIGKYVYPSDPPAEAARKVAAAAVFCDPAGRIDTADIDRQIAWYRSEKLVDASVDSRTFVDPSFTR